MARLNYVKKARKDYPEQEIKKGDSYYWWQFKFRSKQRSKTRPRRSQLTQSSFLGQVFDVEDRLGGITEDMDFESLKSEVDEIVDELNNLMDDTQGSLENMPDQLQQASSGELLQERIDGIQEWITELEGIDCEIDTEGKSKEEILEEKQGVIEEIQGTSYSGS